MRKTNFSTMSLNKEEWKTLLAQMIYGVVLVITIELIITKVKDKSDKYQVIIRVEMESKCLKHLIMFINKRPLLSLQ